MLKLLQIGLFATFIFFAEFGFTYSQEIEANVSVSMEFVPQENRFFVTSMERDLTNYLNNQKFTEMDWEGKKVPVDINIILSGGSNGRFGARLMIIGKRYVAGTEGGTSVTLRFAEENWTFEYQQGAIHAYNPMVFNDFTSLIDYYMLLFIGYDLDTYSDLGGTRAYNQAMQICNLGASKGNPGFKLFANPGEFTKYNLINELTNPRYEEFRLLCFDYYVDGLDLMAQDKNVALDNILSILEDMATFKREKMTTSSVLLQSFFDAKVRELAELFKDTGKTEALELLTYLDPSNSTIYRETIK